MSRDAVRWRSVAVAAGLLLGPPLAAQIRSKPDAQIERCLSTGRIVKRLATLEGVTRPELFELECEEGNRRAIYKTVDREYRGLTRFEDGGWEVNFSDSYRYERTAYLLDRELGLNMVPVAVIRRIKRNLGALIDWIEDASPENDPKSPATPQQMARLAQQKGAMRLFDALIYNVDRNIGNWLVDDRDWRLYLIDHSRSFRELSELPEEFLSRRAWLPRRLYDRLGALDENGLTDLLEGLISRGQIRTLLARRDRLLEKIDRDRELYGDSAVFSEQP